MSIVSVIIPCHNAEPFLQALIESLCAQTLSEWEVVVIDDGSTDRSSEIVERFALLDPRIKLIHQPNQGVARARNHGFSHINSQSRYVYFLDADDLIEPTLLETAVRYLDNQPSVGMVHFGHTAIDSCGQPLPRQTDCVRGLPRLGLRGYRVIEVPTDEPITTIEAILGPAGIVPSVCIMRRSVYERTPGFDEAFGWHYEDTDIFLHMAVRSDIHFVPMRLVKYRHHPGQHTSSTLSAEKADHFNRQRLKLIQKWKHYSNLTQVEQKKLRKGFFIFENGISAFKGFQTAHEKWKQKDYIGSARFFLGALKRRFVFCLFAQATIR